MRINGWQRLWVVMSLAWAVVIFILTADNWPEARSECLSMPEFTLYSLKDENQRRADRDIPPLSISEYKAQIREERIKCQVSLQESHDNLPQEKRGAVIFSIGFWFVSSISAYVTGWLFAWIRRGFFSSGRSN